jgi:hypothetical protein
MGVEKKAVDFSEMSGGKNNNFPRHALAENQVYDCLNAMFLSKGTVRAPGYRGIATTALFDHPVRGEWTYKHASGAETSVVVSNLNIYTVNYIAGTITSIGTLTSDNECYAVNACGKLWICNGVDFVKVEDNFAVYNVQIPTIAGATSALVAGGSLPVGIYLAAVCYARYDAATGYWIYGYPQILTPQTTAAGNLTVNVAVTASTDPQVNKIVVFLSDANGAVYYYYGETANATGTIHITSNANRNGGIRLDTVSAPNQVLPIHPDGIFFFANQIFVWSYGAATLYWSLATDVNPFNLEIFIAENFRTMSLPVHHLLSINANLYINTVGQGVTFIPNGDMTAIAKKTESRLWFLDCKVEEGRAAGVSFRNMWWGMTNDGARYFGGNPYEGGSWLGGAFSDDLSFTVKPDIDVLYAGIGTGFMPSLVMNRRAGKRMEWRISYRDLTVGSTSLNKQLVFNVDFFLDPNASKKCWETWENGFAFQTILNGSWIGVQSRDTGGTIATEFGAADEACYNLAGAFVAARTAKQFYVLTRTHMDNLDSITLWGPVYYLATSSGPIYGNLLMLDQSNSKYPLQISGVQATTAVLPSQVSGLGLVLPFIMPAQLPRSGSVPMPFNCRGGCVALEISQTADDINFEIFALQMARAQQITNKMS